MCRWAGRATLASTCSGAFNHIVAHLLQPAPSRARSKQRGASEGSITWQSEPKPKPTRRRAGAAAPVRVVRVVHPAQGKEHAQRALGTPHAHGRHAPPLCAFVCGLQAGICRAFAGPGAHLSIALSRVSRSQKLWGQPEPAHGHMQRSAPTTQHVRAPPKRLPTTSHTTEQRKNEYTRSAHPARHAGGGLDTGGTPAGARLARRNGQARHLLRKPGCAEFGGPHLFCDFRDSPMENGSQERRL